MAKSHRKGKKPITKESAITPGDSLEILQSVLVLCNKNGFSTQAMNITSSPAPAIGIVLVGGWFCIKCQQFKVPPVGKDYDCGCTNGAPL